MQTTSRPTARNVRNRATHAAILEASAQILNDVGYGRFTIEAVAKRSGAGKPTIYRWWKSKSELFMELYNRESAAMLPVQDLGSVRAELIGQMVALFAFWRDTACGRAFRGLIAESQADEASLARLRDQFMPERRNLARVIFERGCRRGEIDEEAPIDAAIDMLYGFTIYRLLTDQLDNPEPAIHATVDMLLRGLRVQETSTPASSGGE